MLYFIIPKTESCINFIENNIEFKTYNYLSNKIIVKQKELNKLLNELEQEGFIKGQDYKLK